MGLKNIFAIIFKSYRTYQDIVQWYILKSLIIYKRLIGDTTQSISHKIILKNKKRVNLIDMGDFENTKKDATDIASFLGVPLWDLPIKKSPID